MSPYHQGPLQSSTVMWLSKSFPHDQLSANPFQNVSLTRTFQRTLLMGCLNAKTSHQKVMRIAQNSLEPTVYQPMHLRVLGVICPLSFLINCTVALSVEPLPESSEIIVLCDLWFGFKSMSPSVNRDWLPWSCYCGIQCDVDSST